MGGCPMEDVGNGAWMGALWGVGCSGLTPRLCRCPSSWRRPWRLCRTPWPRGSSWQSPTHASAQVVGGGGGHSRGVAAGCGVSPCSRLFPPTDLSTVMKQLASLQQEQDALQQDYEEQKEKMSWWVCTPGASPYPIQSPLGTPNPIPWLIPIHPLASG